MDLDTIIGIAMIVLGVLVFLGEFTVGWMLPILGVILLVLGLLMLLGVVAGGTLTAVLLLVIGVLLYAGMVGVPETITQSLNVVVGVVLIVLGILQVR